MLAGVEEETVSTPNIKLSQVSIVSPYKSNIKYCVNVAELNNLGFPGINVEMHLFYFLNAMMYLFVFSKGDNVFIRFFKGDDIFHRFFTGDVFLQFHKDDALQTKLTAASLVSTT